MTEALENSEYYVVNLDGDVLEILDSVKSISINGLYLLPQAINYDVLFRFVDVLAEDLIVE